jgi:hypothetical protein
MQKLKQTLMNKSEADAKAKVTPAPKLMPTPAKETLMRKPN